MDLDLIVEEMNYYGASKIGNVLSDNEIEVYKRDLLDKKQADIDVNGEEKLLEFDYEVVRDLARFGEEYFELIENNKLNNIVNALLNDKAVIHSYNAIISFPNKKSRMVGFNYHRDQPYFGDVRTSINIMIPLVDYSPDNGSTEYLPTSHSFVEMPSDEFIQNHTVATTGKAGEAFVVDASTWHRAGINGSSNSRPMIVLKYILAPFKQQIDYCFSAKEHIGTASELVKQRLGWDVRVCDSYQEFRVPGERRKFKSGQYDMTNVYIKRN